MAIAAAVVVRGMQHGIASTSKFLMPMLALLLVGLATYSMIKGDAACTLCFLFVLDLTSNVLLPLGGLAIALFVGWATSRAVIAKRTEHWPDRHAGIAFPPALRRARHDNFRCICADA
jgi:SNF family Na+-dependent transporter